MWASSRSAAASLARRSGTCTGTRSRAVAITLAGAKNREELETILDDLVGHEAIVAGIAALVRIGTSPIARWVPEKLTARDSAWRALGPIAAKLVALGFTYGVHASRAYASLPQPV